jgi:hypothetical protein
MKLSVSKPVNLQAFNDGELRTGTEADVIPVLKGHNICVTGMDVFLKRGYLCLKGMVSVFTGEDVSAYRGGHSCLQQRISVLTGKDVCSCRRGHCAYRRGHTLL